MGQFLRKEKIMIIVFFFLEIYIIYISLYMFLIFYRCKIVDYLDDIFGVKDFGY